jgi:hypothetical protein
MSALTIESPKKANSWLTGKSLSWSQIIYARSALRELPTVADAAKNWLTFYSVSLFQANLIARLALDDRNLEIEIATRLAESAMQEAHRRNYVDDFAGDAIFLGMSAVLAATLKTPMCGRHFQKNVLSPPSNEMRNHCSSNWASETDTIQVTSNFSLHSMLIGFTNSSRNSREWNCRGQFVAPCGFGVHKTTVI